jgi:DNA primase
VEACAQGCELGTAEGRSKMVSNAGPLWKQLPEGALKRQLLGELAERSQLGEHELLEVWGIAAPPRPRAKPSRGGDAPFRQRSYGSGHRLTVKPKAVALAELVARAALRHSDAWSWLSNADHHLLCELQPPHGDLFSWLDTRFHEHGGEPWAVLELGIEGQPFAELARRLISLDDMQPHGRALEVQEIAEGEVRRAMNGIQLDALTEEMAQVAALPPSDPGKLQRLYDISRRQQALQQLIRASTS